MTGTRQDQGTTARVGLMLFDEGSSRVFALRDGTIEDAREFAVDLQQFVASGAHARSRGCRLNAAQVRERAADTVRLMTELHDRLPLDRLLLGVPRWAHGPVMQRLPLELAERVIGFVTIPAGAGESAILSAMQQAPRRRKAATRTAAGHLVTPIPQVAIAQHAHVA